MVPNREHPTNACYYAHIATQARFGFGAQPGNVVCEPSIGFPLFVPVASAKRAFIESKRALRSARIKQTRMIGFCYHPNAP